MIKLKHNGKLCYFEIDNPDRHAALAITLSQAIFSLYEDKIRPKLTPRLRMETSGEYGLGYLISGLAAVGFTLDHNQSFNKFTLTSHTK